MRYNAIVLINQIQEKASRLLVGELAKHGIEGIVPSHGEIMVYLFDHREHTMKEIADKIHKTKPTVTVLVDKLVGYGYVTKQKSSDDSRVTFIYLTDKGRALEPIFREIFYKLNSTLYNTLSDSETNALEEMLGRIDQSF